MWTKTEGQCERSTIFNRGRHAGRFWQRLQSLPPRSGFSQPMPLNGPSRFAPMLWPCCRRPGAIWESASAQPVRAGIWAQPCGRGLGLGSRCFGAIRPDGRGESRRRRSEPGALETDDAGAARRGPKIYTRVARVPDFAEVDRRRSPRRPGQRTNPERACR